MINLMCFGFVLKLRFFYLKRCGKGQGFTTSTASYLRKKYFEGLSC